MELRSQRILAILVTLVGLCILLLVQPDTETTVRLRGIVVDDDGSRSTVLTNVTLIARDVKRGDTIDVAVFWGGDAFVAVPSRP